MPLIPLAIIIGYFVLFELSLKATIIGGAVFASLWAFHRNIIVNSEDGASGNSIAVFLMLLGSFGTVGSAISIVLQLLR